MCKGTWQNINENTYIYCGPGMILIYNKQKILVLSRCIIPPFCSVVWLYSVYKIKTTTSNWNEYCMVSNFWSMKKKRKTVCAVLIPVLSCYGKRGWTKLTLQTFFHQCISESVEKFSPQQKPARYKPYTVGINHITRRWRPFTFTSRSC